MNLLSFVKSFILNTLQTVNRHIIKDLRIVYWRGDAGFAARRLTLLIRTVVVFSCFIQIVLCSVIYAQPELAWMKTYGGPSDDRCNQHLITQDGGFALAGGTASYGNGSMDWWLLKTNADGDSLWSKAYGTDSGDWCNAILEMEDGGFLLFGQIRGAPWDENPYDVDLAIIRTDDNGDSLWSKVYGSDPENDWTNWDEITAAIRLSGGGYAVAGKTYSLGNGASDCFLMKLDEHCDSLWLRTYGGRGDDFCYELTASSTGGFALTGRTSSYRNGPGDYLVIFTDVAGDSLWSFTTGTDRADAAFAFIEREDSTFIVSGLISEVIFQGNNIQVTCFNGENEILWEREFGETGHEKQDACHAAIQDKEGNTVMTGYFAHFNENERDYDNYTGLIKLNQEGEMIYERYYPAEVRVLYKSLIQHSDRSYSLAGRTILGAREGNQDDFILAKTGADYAEVTDQGRNYLLPPSSFLSVPFPNPFNERAVVTYRLPFARRGDLTVYDLGGRTVIQLPIMGTGSPGQQDLSFDGNLPSGVYHIVLHSGGEVNRRQAVLLR